MQSIMQYKVLKISLKLNIFNIKMIKCAINESI